jgi:hypothetical protein
MVDLVPTSLDQLIFIMKIFFTIFYKTRYLNEDVNRTEPFPSVSVPGPPFQTNSVADLKA